MTQREIRRRWPRPVLVTAVAVVAAMLAGLAPAVDRLLPARAAGAQAPLDIPCPVDLCGWVVDGEGRLETIFPELDEGPYQATPAEQAALHRLEATAVQEIIADHGLHPDDGRAVMTYARFDVRARVWASMATSFMASPSDRTADQQLVYDWFQGIMQAQAIDAARAAIREFNLWADAPPTWPQDRAYTGQPGLGEQQGNAWVGRRGICGYRAPAPLQNEYNGHQSQGCRTPCPIIDACPIPYPSFDELIRWGQQTAYGDKAADPDSVVLGKESARGMGTIAAGLVAGAGVRLSLAHAPGVVNRLLAAYSPHAFRPQWKGAEVNIPRIRAINVVGLGAAALTIVLAIVAAVLELVRVIGIDELDDRLNAQLDTALAAGPDLAVAAATPTGLGGMYSAFIGATSPEFDDVGYEPADVVTDHVFTDGPSGTGTTTTSDRIQVDRDDEVLTTRLEGGWFVHEIRDANGTVVSRRPSLHLDTTDPDGTEMSYTRVVDEDGRRAFLALPTASVPDGVAECFAAGAGCRLTDTIEYAAPGGARRSAKLTPNQAPRLVTIDVLGTPTEGGTVRLKATAVDEDADLDFQWAVPVPFGTSPFLYGEEAEWHILRSGQLEIRLFVRDPWGLETETRTTIDVENIGPRVQIDAPPDVFNPYWSYEGGPFVARGRVIDPGAGRHAFRVDWGDGTSTEKLWEHPVWISCAPLVGGVPGEPPPDCIDIQPTPQGAEVTFRTVYREDSGDGTFLMTATDSESGMTDSASTRVKVYNVAPTADPQVGATGLQGVLIAEVRDPGVDDVLSATIDWGDGSDPVDAEVHRGATPGDPSIVWEVHGYTRPGTYPVELTVSDDDGGTSTEVVDLVVAATPPTPVAGPDRTAPERTTVTLDGTASVAPNGSALAYSWFQTGGPPVELVDQFTATPSFVVPEGPGELTFELVVLDEFAAEYPDRVGRDAITVTIEEVDRPPLADAGDDLTVDERSTATLDGSGSTDPDGDAVALSWTQVGGPAVTLAAPDTATPSFTVPEAPATLTFRLSVDDGHGEVATDDVTVTARDVNRPPTAHAGPAQAVAAGAEVALDATGSSDPDGDDLGYRWVQTAGPTVAVADATTATPSFTAPSRAAALTFAVTVDDGHGGTATATVTITVLPPPLTAQERYVVEVYATFLHRPPDAGGLTYWVGSLAAGASRATVARRIALGIEATRVVVADRYATWLGRVASPAERTYWSDRLRAGLPLASFERSLLASPEARAHAGGTDGDHVTALYQALLGRAPDAAGLQHWTGRLAAGASRLAVVDGMLSSAESRRHRVGQTYLAVVGRTPTGIERDIAVALLLATRDIRLVAVSVLAAHGVQAT